MSHDPVPGSADSVDDGSVDLAFDDEDDVIPKITLGVCAMDKKVSGKPMQEILRRIAEFEGGMFDIIVFGNDTILNKPIEEWPVVHCLLSFFSTGFPLEKAEAYVELRKPFCVNNLSSEHLLRDRRLFYGVMRRHHIPVPHHVVLNRDGFEGKPNSVVQEFEDYVVVDGTRVNKPFVEKPVDAEDHNVYIYYPRAQGGGSKRLFRKIGDKSSEFYPDVSTIRTEGSFIYEEFMMTQGTDIKIYAVGRGYAHAEARKSPTLDGKVQRDKEGKEVRYPIMLTAREKWMAQEVCAAFKQNVVGCDLLRTHDRSYICDVNGWSFVKKSTKYYDDTSHVLVAMMIRAIRPELLSRAGFHELSQPMEYVRAAEGVPEQRGEELRCVVAVLRHGDRTAKQKLKLVTAHPRILALTEKYTTKCVDGAVTVEKEAKLKTALELGDFLTTVAAVVEESLAVAAEYHGSDVDANEAPDHHVEVVKWLQIKSVLEKEKFSGINRKAQLKWRTGESGKPAVLIVVKWGGVLTHAGVAQARELGKWFRSHMYPGESTGLLRLHSSFRHDLKIYSSDEGRVQMTAAAFAKGLLDLDGGLTPILASLVRSFNTNDMLDDTRCARDEQRDMKERLGVVITREAPAPAVAADLPSGAEGETPSKRLILPIMSPEDVQEAICPTHAASGLAFLQTLGPDLRSQLALLHAKLDVATKYLEALANRVEPLDRLPETVASELKLTSRVSRQDLLATPITPSSTAVEGLGGSTAQACCGGESLWLVLQRWKKLTRDFYNRRKEKFDTSKIPDIYDILKYYKIHNCHLAIPGIDEVYCISRALAGLVVPQEYGITFDEKRAIGTEITHHLLRKIMFDITAGRTVAPAALPAIPSSISMASAPTVSLFESPKPRREPPPRADVSELPLPDLPPLPPLRRPSVPLVPTIPSPSPATKTTRTLYSTPSQMDLATVAATTIDVYGPPPSPSSLPVAPSDYLPLDAPPPHVSRSPKPGGSSASLASRKSSEHDCEVLGSPTIMAPELLKKSSSSVGVPDTDSVEGSQGSGMAAGREQDMAPGHDTNESSIHETVHVLDQTSLQPDDNVDSKTSTAHVRTRLYFTSESHVQSLLNALYCWSSTEGLPKLFAPSGEKLLSATTELDYLTHIVFRLFENFDVPRDDPKRTRIEVSVSPGASVDVMTGMPYAPYDSLSEDVTSLHLSSEVSGSLLKMVKSHTSPPEVGRVKPTLTQASSFRTRGKMGSRPVPSKEVSPAATPTPPPTPPVQKQVFFDREQHLLAVLPCVPVSAPSLTLTELEASLLAAIQSVEPDGSPAAVPRL